MKHMRLWGVVGAFSLLVALALSALARSQGVSEPVFSGGSYLSTIKDAGGNFASRSVITLHADHTMLAADSAQQGPTDYFGNQLGDWKPAGNHRVAGRTINFEYPLSPNGPSVVRSDYVINLAPDRRHVAGTITVTAVPLQDGNPFADDGTSIGTFTFEGERIEP